MKWVSVFEGKPNQREEVLCYLKNGKMQILQLEGNMFVEIHTTDLTESFYKEEPSPVQFWMRIKAPCDRRLKEIKRLAVEKGTW